MNDNIDFAFGNIIDDNPDNNSAHQHCERQGGCTNQPNQPNYLNYYLHNEAPRGRCFVGWVSVIYYRVMDNG